MKFSVEQHKEHLQNMYRHLQEKREKIERMNADMERLRKECVALDSQIIEAEVRGVDGFESERFGIKKKVAATSPPPQEPKL